MFPFLSEKTGGVGGWVGEGRRKGASAPPKIRREGGKETRDRWRGEGSCFLAGVKMKPMNSTQ